MCRLLPPQLGLRHNTQLHLYENVFRCAENHCQHHKPLWSAALSISSSVLYRQSGSGYVFPGIFGHVRVNMSLDLTIVFSQVLAKEEPSTRVLNYAPGPVETNMLNQLRVETWNPEMKDNTSGALTPETTCYRLIQLLAENKYPSGAHVDYFDSPFE